MRGIEPRAFHMQSERSTTELHPLNVTTLYNVYKYNKVHQAEKTKETQQKIPTFTVGERRGRLIKGVNIPTGGLEPPIFGLGDRRLIH